MASCGKDEDGVRKIGVAMDYSASSKRALEWAIRNLLRRGDTLVVLVVQHSSGDEAKRAALWAKSGSRKHILARRSSSASSSFPAVS
jgi:nucleotide-binding universal stress UspA family protein